MRTGRPTAELRVTNEERAALERWARRPKTAQALALRARIVLACAAGTTNTVVAARVRVTRQKVQGPSEEQRVEMWTAGQPAIRRHAPQSRRVMTTRGA